MVRVIFSNRTAGVVDYEILELLIRKGKVSAFFLDEWIILNNEAEKNQTYN